MRAGADGGEEHAQAVFVCELVALAGDELAEPPATLPKPSRQTVRVTILGIAYGRLALVDRPALPDRPAPATRSTVSSSCSTSAAVV